MEQMGIEVKVEVVKKEIIRPSSPTPPELINFKLSIIDQLNRHLYVSLLLFYPEQVDTQQLTPAEKSWKLKSSLSRILTHFYPLAGRIKDNFWIQCDDEGVEYIETEISCSLSDVLKRPEFELLEKFLPRTTEPAEASRGFLLRVQANFFKHGGLVIGICISHKISDAATLSIFTNAWAGLAVESKEVVLPKFQASSMFPPMENLPSTPTTEVLLSGKHLTRRYVLDTSKITELKSRAASASVPKPTSVEAVTALIWKCATTASRKNHNQDSPMKPSLLSQAVNLRNRLDPPLPNNSAGNLSGLFIARTEETELDLQTLVARLREGIEEMRDCIEQLAGEHASLLVCQTAAEYKALEMDDSIEFYGCSSWCRFPLYEADFGWGKPTWASNANSEFNNLIMLMDGPEGQGIEAWVTMSEADMAIFEQDQEILEFLSLNPSINIPNSP